MVKWVTAPTPIVSFLQRLRGYDGVRSALPALGDEALKAISGSASRSTGIGRYPFTRKSAESAVMLVALFVERPIEGGDEV